MTLEQLTRPVIELKRGGSIIPSPVTKPVTPQPVVFLQFPTSTPTIDLKGGTAQPTDITADWKHQTEFAYPVKSNFPVITDIYSSPSTLPASSTPKPSEFSNGLFKKGISERAAQTIDDLRFNYPGNGNDGTNVISSTSMGDVVEVRILNRSGGLIKEIYIDQVTGEEVDKP